MILFDLDQFLDGINLDQADADLDGVVRINSGSNADIAVAIWSKLHLIMLAGEDVNGDDKLDGN